VARAGGQPAAAAPEHRELGKRCKRIRASTDGAAEWLRRLTVVDRG
jgi:hypothetical protein